MNQTKKPDREPGLKCPACGAFIRTSIEELLTVRSLYCEVCHLELHLDRWASAKALSALQKVQEAQRKVQESSKFNR